MLDNLKNQDFPLRHVPGLTVQIGMHSEGDKHYIRCPPGVAYNNTREIHLNSKIIFSNGVKLVFD